MQGKGGGARQKKRRLDSVITDIREKGLSGEEVYDQAVLRQTLSYIDHIKVGQI